MIKLSITFFTGLIVLYFLDSAFKIENMNLEMFTHNLVRFFAGFVFLGIWVWYEHKLKFKIALYLILFFLISDDIFDYIRDVDSMSLEVFIHDFVVVLWGALSGFFFVKHIVWNRNQKF